MTKSPDKTAIKFLSTPSARRATPVRGRLPASCAISIHALCEEGDPVRTVAKSATKAFLSTPSARRATVRPELPVIPLHISIHALCEEGDRPC